MARSNVSYEDFIKEAGAAGLLNSFSQADLELAAVNPEAGMSILSFKKDYAAAPSDEARALANAGAERVRREYGSYLGGRDGSGYTPLVQSAEPMEEENYVNQIAARTDAAPETSPDSFYKDAAKLWSDYRKQYLREGDRAYQNSLGSAAANTGGIASTAAITAAQQAQNYYGAQLADRKAELYQQAYENWLAGQSNDRQNRQLESELQNASATLALRQAEQAAAEQSAAAKAGQQAFDNALAKWKAYGYVTADIAQTLALPVGTAYTDQAEKEWEQAYKEASSGVFTNKTQYDAVNLGQRKAPGDSASKHGTLRVGSNSLDVQTMQRYLIALGYSCGASGADGKFGNATQQSLLAFQRDYGVYPDGVCGPVTWTALIDANGA